MRWSYCPPEAHCPTCRLIGAVESQRRRRLQRRRDFVIGSALILGAALVLALVEGFTTTVFR